MIASMSVLFLVQHIFSDADASSFLKVDHDARLAAPRAERARSCVGLYGLHHLANCLTPQGGHGGRGAFLCCLLALKVCSKFLQKLPWQHLVCLPLRFLDAVSLHSPAYALGQLRRFLLDHGCQRRWTPAASHELRDDLSLLVDWEDESGL
jgi:hypothetical protein